MRKRILLESCKEDEEYQAEVKVIRSSMCEIEVKLHSIGRKNPFDNCICVRLNDALNQLDQSRITDTDWTTQDPSEFGEPE